VFDIDSPFTMVVMIVLISVGAGVVNNYLKTKANTRVDADLDDELHKMRVEVDQLRERVRVLETIATDKDRTLRDEISRLA